MATGNRDDLCSVCSSSSCYSSPQISGTSSVSSNTSNNNNNMSSLYGRTNCSIMNNVTDHQDQDQETDHEKEGIDDDDVISEKEGFRITRMSNTLRKTPPPEFIDFLKLHDHPDNNNKRNIDTSAIIHDQVPNNNNINHDLRIGPSILYNMLIRIEPEHIAPPPPVDQEFEQRQAVILLNPEEDIGDEYYWSIKKVLKKSDCDGSARLLLAKAQVELHILPYIIHMANNNNIGGDDHQGIQLSVWDVDTQTQHMLVLKLWRSGSYVLTKNWSSDFVKRRGLQKDREIGLRWDRQQSRLHFTLFH